MIYAVQNDIDSWGATGISLGETKMGPATGREVTDLARSSYSCYNSGSRQYRYKLTRSEASALEKNISCYDIMDSYGYDARDNNFWNYYWNQLWN